MKVYLLKSIGVGAALFISLAMVNVAKAADGVQCGVFVHTSQTSVRAAAEEIARVFTELDSGVSQDETLSPQRVSDLISEHLERGKEQYARLSTAELKALIQHEFDLESKADPHQLRGCVSATVTLEEMLADLRHGGGQFHDVWGNRWQSLNLSWHALQAYLDKPNSKLKPGFYERFKASLVRALPLEVLRVRLIRGEMDFQLPAEHSLRSIAEFSFN